MKAGDFKVFAAMCREAGLPIPQKEWEFSGDRKFRADIAWPSNDPPVALEVDGGVYGRGKPCPVCKRKQGGAHSSVKDILRDMEKTNEYAVQGWRLLRITPQQLHKTATIELVKRAMLG